MRASIRSLCDKAQGRPLLGVEVGVFDGEHAEQMLEAIPNLRLYLVDPYEAYAGYNDSKIGGLSKARRDTARRLRRFGNRILWVYARFDHGLINEPVDFVYIDGNHDYEYVKKDLMVAEGIVKPGGIVAGHDYYHDGSFGVKIAVDEWCRKRKRRLNVEDIDWWFTKSPRIFFVNLNVGSGIERTGNLIVNMLEQYEVKEYKHQNPPCITITELLKYQPDVVIMNEFYPRVIKAAYYYKKMYPETVVVLINHCYDRITALPYDKSYGRTDSDGVVLLNYFFRDIDAVVNLNHHPPGEPYPGFVNVVDATFPIDKKFKVKVPWSKRKKDFMYYGNVNHLKFSKHFAEECNIPIDVYGKINDEYSFSPSVNVCGFIEESQLIDTINEYRFLVVPHTGREPFNLTIAEAIHCGTIPLVIKKGDWINWAEGCYVPFEDLSGLLSGMEEYLSEKQSELTIKRWEGFSEYSADTLRGKMSPEKFASALMYLIGRLRA